jgi:hypothetical protein
VTKECPIVQFQQRGAAMTARRLIGGVAALGVGLLPPFLVFTLIASPVLAADECIPTRTAFSPGTWVASGITLNASDDDGHSVVQDHGEGGFRLTITEQGDASGSISLVGSGVAASYLDGDDSGMTVEWMVNGTLSGNGLYVQVDGTQDLTISGVIDSNPNGSGDEWSGSGNEFWGFGNQTSREYHSAFSASAANCDQVFGSLGGPAEFGTQTPSESYFLAVRVGAAPDIDLEAQLDELMERANDVLHMDPVDTDVLGDFIVDFLAFDALVASLEDCELEGADVGPAWEMLRSVLLAVAHQFLGAAESGAYENRSVIGVMTLLLQGGLLGLRGNDCLEANGNTEGLGEILDRFDLVLLERLKDADRVVSRLEGSEGDIREIVAAAYQFQLPTTIQYIEESL